MLELILDPANYLLNPHAIPVFVTAVSSLVLGTGVLLQERASRESALFFLLTVFVSVWLLAFSVMYSARTADVALWWGKMAYIGVPLIAPAVYHFAVVLLRVYEARRLIVRLAWLGSATFGVLILATDQILTGLYRYPWGYYVRFDVSSAPYLAFFIGLLALALQEYRTAYRRAKTESRRNRIKWLALAFGIGYLALIDYLPCFGLHVYPVGYISIFGFLVVAGWTIQRYRLVDLTPSFAAEKIVQTMVDSLLVCDTQGRIEYANPASCRALECDASQLLHSRLDSLIDAPPEQARRLAGLLLDSTVRDSEFTLRSRTGDRIEVSPSTSPLYDRDGLPVGTVVIARDIGERKRMSRDLRESERRFRLLLENVIDYGLVMLDPEGHVESWNEGAQRIFDYSQEEIVGRHVSIFFPEEEIARGAPQRELRVAREQGRFEETAWRVRKDGEKLWANVVVTSIRDPKSELIGFAKVVRDLTRQRELEEQLLQSQKMEAIGRLAGGIAHDFNNILTVISGHTQLLLQDVPGRDETLRELRTIKQAADRAANLTRQVLAFSRRQVMQPQVLDLNEVVTEVEQMLRRVIGEDIEFVTILDPDLGSIRADRGQLEQVLLNLAVNARDAMPEGGKLIVETANAALAEHHAEALDLEHGPHVMLAVSDTGTGMDRETLSRIFEPFFTTKERDRGTGLVLSTVHGIVKQSGGSVLVYSEPGHGTSFKIYLPRVRETRTGSETPERPEELRTGSETVLLVEDDIEVRDFVRTLLGKCGYRVLDAGSADEALSLCASEGAAIDLVLTDVILPHGNGRELAERLTRLRPGLRIVYMSGYTESAIGENGVLDPDMTFIQKPFTLEALSQKLRSELDRPRDRTDGLAASAPD